VGREANSVFVRVLKGFVTRIYRHGQGDSVTGGSADQRRTAYDHVENAGDDILDGSPLHGFKQMW